MSRIAVIGTGYVGLVSGACLADFGNSVVCVKNEPRKIETLLAGDPYFRARARGSGIAECQGAAPLLLARPRRRRQGLRDGFHRRGNAARGGREGRPQVRRGGFPRGGQGNGRLSRDRGQEHGARRDCPEGPSLDRRGVGAQVRGLRIRRRLQPGIPKGGLRRPGLNPPRPSGDRGRERARQGDHEGGLPLPLPGRDPLHRDGARERGDDQVRLNAFLAVKITFINEVANLCERVSADVQDVAKAMGRDGRIGAKFLHPGPGYGGSCFPKDTHAMARTGRDYGERLSIVEATIEANEAQKARMVRKIEAGLGGPGSLRGTTIAVLGLAFKPNTDDMRDAPALAICEGLVARGARLRAWDPEAMKEAAWRLKPIEGSLYMAVDEYDALSGADALVLVTEWNQLRNLDLDRVKGLLRSPVFFDLRNVYKRSELEARGFSYFGVGR